MSVRKVYLPRWMSRLGVVGGLAMWLLVTYMIWFAQPAAEREVTGWIIATVVLAVMVVVVHLMGQRKLPVYLIEDGDEE